MADNTLNVVQAGMGAVGGIQQMSEGNYTTGGLLLGLSAVGMHGAMSGMKSVSKVENAMADAAAAENRVSNTIEDAIPHVNPNVETKLEKVSTVVNNVVDSAKDFTLNVKEKLKNTLNNFEKENDYDGYNGSLDQLKRQQGIEEALRKVGMSVEEVDDINIKASKLNNADKEAIQNEIEKVQKVSNEIGLPKEGEKISKVSPYKENPFSLEGGKHPEITGFVARCEDVKNIKNLPDTIVSLGLNYENSPYIDADKYIVDQVPATDNILGEIDHPFNNEYASSSSGPPYTNTGFTSGGVKEYFANSQLVDKEANKYAGQPISEGTVRTVYDRSGNIIESALWKTEVINGRKIANWYGKNIFGKYNIPLNKGGIDLGPVKK